MALFLRYNTPMLFAVDIGNTNIVYGLFRGDSLIRTWRVPTGKLKIPDIDFEVTGIVVCSVVPKVEAKLKKYLSRHFKVKPVFVSASNVPIKVKLKDKKAIGADRLVNAYAALKLYGAPVVVVDFGTAT
ncbi:MAG: type III pantothenate kinase, partial [Candidatus Saganbacteria bacterium]|nr:type III pantothenate kinase [Candidatus Saganbacteria bacterium]